VAQPLCADRFPSTARRLVGLLATCSSTCQFKFEAPLEFKIDNQRQMVRCVAGCQAFADMGVQFLKRASRKCFVQ